MIPAVAVTRLLAVSFAEGAGEDGGGGGDERRISERDFWVRWICREYRSDVGYRGGGEVGVKALFPDED